MTEDRGQRTEDGGQMTEDRRGKKNDFGSGRRLQPRVISSFTSISRALITSFTRDRLAEA